ncbi:MAG: serine O-acetyltransferase [Pseudomonadota bacterium]
MSHPIVAHVWETLHAEALALRRTEPFLAPILDHMVLAATSLSEALARRLAVALASAEIPVEAYHDLALEAFLNDPSLVVATARDLVAVQARDPACQTQSHAFLNYKAFHAVQLHRVAHGLWLAERRALAAWLSNRVAEVLGPDIHPAAQLGVGIMLDHGAGIVIGETAVLEDNVTLLQNVTLGGTGKTRGDRHPKLRQGVMIGAGANIIGNVAIGAYSKVGAGSVVLKDIPAHCTVAGVPAQIVRLHPHRASAVPVRPTGGRVQVCKVPRSALPPEVRI